MIHRRFGAVVVSGVVLSIGLAVPAGQAEGVPLPDARVRMVGSAGTPPASSSVTSVTTLAPSASAAPAAPAPGAASGPAGGDFGDLGAGMPSDGTAMPPSRDVKAILKAQSDPLTAAAKAGKQANGTSAATGSAAHTNALTALPMTFPVSSYTVRAVSPAWLPYIVTTPEPLVDPSVHDAQGVRMFKIGTKLFDHPVRQAQYGIANLESYRITQDQRYLDRAIAQANRLVANKIISRGAWYLPYPFDFALHSLAADTLKAPWYSGMAQGQALSLFVRLFQVTQDPQWMTAADGVAATFVNPPATGLPWVAQLDPSGWLWLEEYPESPASKSDFTFNGHMFATLGLYDYYMQTQDAAIRRVYDGAVTTVKHYAPVLRSRSWISRYCVKHVVLNAHYHWVVTDEMRYLFSQTGDSALARLSDTFYSDFPIEFTSRVRFPAGSTTGYKFNPDGSIVTTKTIKLSKVSTAAASSRDRVKGRGYYYTISAGSLAGYQVGEGGTVYALGQSATRAFEPQRRATFVSGTYVGNKFDAKGLVAATTKITVTGSSTAPFDATAEFGGGRYVHFTAGRLTGYWVLQSRVTLI